MSKLYVIGVGFRPLDARAKDALLNSAVILANNRLIEVFKDYDEFEKVKNKIKVINNVDETIGFIRSLLVTYYSSRFRRSFIFWNWKKGNKGIWKRQCGDTA